MNFLEISQKFFKLGSLTSEYQFTLRTYGYGIPSSDNEFRDKLKNRDLIDNAKKGFDPVLYKAV